MNNLNCVRCGRSLFIETDLIVKSYFRCLCGLKTSVFPTHDSYHQFVYDNGIDNFMSICWNDDKATIYKNFRVIHKDIRLPIYIATKKQLDKYLILV